MAKKIVYDLVIDTADSQNSMKRIEERLKVLGETAGSSQKQVNTLQRELEDLANIKIDNASNVTSVKDLRKAYKDLVDLQLQFGSDSDVFQKASLKAGELKDKLADVQDGIKNFSNSPVENLSNSFTTLRTKILALDLQGTKAAFGNLVTNFSALATSTIGITTGMSAATVATRAFTAALVATGIGAFVVAIGLIIANFETLKNSGGLIGKTFTFIGDVIEQTTVAFLKLSDAIGLTETALDDYNKTKVDDKTASINKTISTINKLTPSTENLTFALNFYRERLALLDKDVEKSNKKLEELDAKRKKITSEKYPTKSLNDTVDGYETGGKILPGTGVTGKAAIEKLNEQLEQEYNLTLKSNIKLLSEQDRYNQELSKKEKEMSALLRGTLDYNTKNLITTQKKGEEERLKALEEAYNAELKSIENKKTLRDIDANESYTTDEVLKDTLLASETKFLSDKLSLNQRYGKETLSIRLSQAQAEVKIQQDFYNEDRKNADARIKGNEEIMKSMNDRLSLLDKIGTRKKELDLTEIGDLQTEILVADERLRVLEQYGIDSGVIYDDAIHKKMVAEQGLTEFLRKEGDKRKEEEAAKQKEIISLRRATIQASLQGSNTLTSALQRLSNTVYENEIANAEGNAVVQEKLRKEQFEANKAFAIVNAVINTALAVTQALSSSPPPASWILAALNGVAGAVEIAAISSQQYTSTGGGVSSAASGNAAGSQAFSAAAQTPNINFAASSSGSNLNESGLGSQNPSFTGFVSVSEINNVQNNIQAMEGSSLLGG